MDEGLSYETLTVSVPSQGLAHLVLISLSSYLNIHSRSALSERQEMRGHIQYICKQSFESKTNEKLMRESSSCVSCVYPEQSLMS